MVTLYKNRHFSGMMYIDDKWWLYDPLNLANGTKIKEEDSIPKDQIIGNVIYGKC